MPTVRAFPPLDPLLNARVDPPSYGWSRAATHAYFNQTVQLARLLKRESPNTPGVDGRTALHVRSGNQRAACTSRSQTVRREVLQPAAAAQ